MSSQHQNHRTSPGSHRPVVDDNHHAVAFCCYCGVLELSIGGSTRSPDATCCCHILSLENVLQVNNPRYKRHTFDGDGMILSFEFNRGDVRFSNKYVRTKGFLDEQASPYS